LFWDQRCEIGLSRFEVNIQKAVVVLCPPKLDPIANATLSPHLFGQLVNVHHDCCSCRRRSLLASPPATPIPSDEPRNVYRFFKSESAHKIQPAVVVIVPEQAGNVSLIQKPKTTTTDKKKHKQSQITHWQEGDQGRIPTQRERSHTGKTLSRSDKTSTKPNPLKKQKADTTNKTKTPTPTKQETREPPQHTKAEAHNESRFQPTTNTGEGRTQHRRGGKREYISRLVLVDLTRLLAGYFSERFHFEKPLPYYAASRGSRVLVETRAAPSLQNNHDWYFYQWPKNGDRQVRLLCASNFGIHRTTTAFWIFPLGTGIPIFESLVQPNVQELGGERLRMSTFLHVSVTSKGTRDFHSRIWTTTRPGGVAIGRGTRRLLSEPLFLTGQNNNHWICYRSGGEESHQRAIGARLKISLQKITK